MAEELDWVNLMDIIERPGTIPGHEERRIAAFAVHDGTVHVHEECDDYFTTELSPEEIRRLIAWLQAAVS